MGAFIYLIFYILLVIELIWWFTCTKHEDAPLALELVVAVLSFIPVVHIIFCIVFPIFCYKCVKDYDIELKNNWFNRTFLAYHE